MFKIKDKFLYEKYKGWTIVSSYRKRENSWHCCTKKGKYLIIRMIGGTLQLSASEREYDAISGGEVVAYVEGGLFDFSDPQKIKELLSHYGQSGSLRGDEYLAVSFSNIAAFFDWKYDENDIWDATS